MRQGCKPTLRPPPLCERRRLPGGTPDSGTALLAARYSLTNPARSRDYNCIATKRRTAPEGSTAHAARGAEVGGADRGRHSHDGGREAVTMATMTTPARREAPRAD